MTKLTRCLAILLGAFLWSGTASADLDDIRRSAEAGDNAAQLELGILFQYGFNYKDNEIPALTWYMLSANAGNAKAVKLRDALKAKMSEQEVQEAMGQVAGYKPSGQPVSRPVAPAPAAAPAPPAAAPEPATAPMTGTPSAPAPVEQDAAPEAIPVIDAQAPVDKPAAEESLPVLPATK